MHKKRRKGRSKKKLRRRVIDPDKLMLLRQFFIGFIVLVFAALIVTGLWYGTRISSLTITKVSIEGGETIPHEQIRTRAEAVLQGTYLRLIPRRFVWWYPHAVILAAIKDIPRMKNPTVTRISNTEIHISFSEYKPYALWCEVKNPDTCLFIDSDGYAFGTAPVLSGGSFIRFHSLEQLPILGTNFLDIAKLSSITKFIQLLRIGLRYGVVTVETDSMGDVFYILTGGSEIKTNLLESATTTYANLESILSATKFKHLTPGNFQYIDLRFGNKVYVNDNPLSTASNTATSTDRIQIGSSTVLQ